MLKEEFKVECWVKKLEMCEEGMCKNRNFLVGLNLDDVDY